MRAKLLIFSTLFFISSCGSEEVFQVAGYENALENVLTLELSFGSDEEILKSEFLLAKPYGIAVNDNNDILVTDENKIKIFDADGNEKMILGGTGEGPGEFSRIREPFLSPTGFLIVEDRGIYGPLNVFSPENEFLSRLAFYKLPSNISLMKRYNYGKNIYLDGRFVYLNDKERIYGGITLKPRSDNPRLEFDILVYDRPDTTLLLAEYTDTNSLQGKLSGLSFYFLGDLLWDVLPDRRILYTHPGHNRIVEDKEPYYILYVFSMDNFETSTIKRPYIPVEIDFSEVRKSDETYDYYEKELKNFFHEKKYFAPILKLYLDGYTLFALTLKKNDKGEFLTDVFDLREGKYLKSVYFPAFFVSFFPAFEVKTIKNGYIYRLTTNDDGFYIVEKYKIDPAVYGK